MVRLKESLFASYETDRDIVLDNRLESEKYLVRSLMLMAILSLLRRSQLPVSA